MFEFQLAPFIIAGLVVVVTGYMFSRWLVNLGQLRNWTAVAQIGWRHNDELTEQIAGMQAEGCAAVSLVQNIFNGLTSPSAIGPGVSLSTQQKMADACAKLLTEASQCDHKAQAEHSLMRAESWEKIADRLADEQIVAIRDIENLQLVAQQAEGRAQEAERLLGLVNDRIAVLKSELENE